MDVRTTQELPSATDQIATDEVEELATMIRALKTRHEWTLEEMHRRCPSVSLATINNVVRGKRPTVRTLRAILGDLGLNPLELRGWYAQWQRLGLFEAADEES